MGTSVSPWQLAKMCATYAGDSSVNPRVMAGAYIHSLFSSTRAVSDTHKGTLHTLNTPSYPLNTGYATPTHTPYSIESAQAELRSEGV
jgi:hypothetical protein